MYSAMNRSRYGSTDMVAISSPDGSVPEMKSETIGSERKGVSTGKNDSSDESEVRADIAATGMVQKKVSPAVSTSPISSRLCFSANRRPVPPRNSKSGHQLAQNN